MLFVRATIEFASAVFFDGELGCQRSQKHVIWGRRGCRGGAEMCAAPCAQEATQPVRVVWILKNAFSENDGTCSIKWWWIQIVCQKIGTQTTQKRKNWEMRTWELVGTQIPRWHLAATSRWPPSYMYVYMHLGLHRPRHAPACVCVRCGFTRPSS